jgi:hypothetical protein
MEMMTKFLEQASAICSVSDPGLVGVVISVSVFSNGSL